MFKLDIKAGDKKIIYNPLSAGVRYLFDEKKFKSSFESLIKVLNVKVSSLQIKDFLSNSGSELKIAKSGGKPDELFLFKVKLNENFSADYFRNHLAGFLSSLQNSQIKNLHVFIPGYKTVKDYFNKEEYYYQSFIEGVLFGNYSFNKYKTEKKNLSALKVYFYAEDTKKLKNAVQKAKIVMEGVYFTKDLQNEPAINLTPNIFSNRVGSVLRKNGVKVKIYNEREIKKMKMGGLLSVGMGSDNPPKFMVLEYNGTKNKTSKKIALVGKGITFDSGGISIKPAANMGEMKGDMSGGAVVAGTILSAAKAKLPVHLYGLIPTAENMVSGKSMRPGDIIVTSSGKSIEVDNTDAEGRLILADALNYASKLKPDVIIDLATLTGACMVALGEYVAGLFTKNKKLSDSLYNNGIKTYDRVWPLPMWDEYNELLKSDVADVINVGGRWAGAITAAKFLEHFVDKKIPWAHLDIAGPAFSNNLNNYTKKYMTGFGVRLLFEYLAEY